MFKTPVLATAIALAAIATATPAAANDKAWQVGNNEMHLYYSGFDLNSAAGRANLLASVERAAARLCRDRNDERECVADAVAATSHQPQAVMLRLALAERSPVRFAAR